MFDIDKLYVVPLDQWIQVSVGWLALHFRPLFLTIKWPVETILSAINNALHAVPFPVLTIVFALIAWRVASRGVGIFTLISLVVIAFIGLWSEAMTTLSLIATAIVVCVILGIPIGILCARSDRAWSIIRPVLDI